MLSRNARLITAVGFAMVIAQAARSEAAPITIFDVQVIIGTSVYDATRVGWTFPYTLNSGEDLVLAQSFNGAPNRSSSYSFDTSDEMGPAIVPVIRVTTSDGAVSTFSDTTQVLNTRGLDLGFDILGEAQNFTLLSGPAGIGYRVYVGYADNVHTGACGGGATLLGLNGSSTCFPEVFNGATYRDFAPGLLPDIPLPNLRLPNHCAENEPTCFETGVIRILAAEPGQPVPEPASLTLLMTGGGMLLARRYRRGKLTRT